ncbi:hypothetical protein [Bythopirellula polymerisocia]|uniref:LTXXQ motif protein n=1 Tax=Bythopirellula polymerisocia TaxID=2528003 RepID=A0A5C6CGW4_9BACT|nr:hypothetical protein [Bythopirellula polymerisocia]TWU21979.1 hypothetical protein Pla144_44460 [Bythopirellula polymerisocia]
MNNKNALIGVAILLVLAVIGWGWYGGKDPALAELEKLRDEQFARRNEVTEEEQKAGRQAFGEKMKGLSEEQRRSFFESSAPFFMKMMEARLDQFLALTPEEQKKELDKKIDESLARQKNGGGPTAGGGPGGGRPGGGPPTPQKVDEFRKKMLDWTTPEQRAKFQTTMQMYNDRMKQRGLDPKAGGGGGRFF